MNLRLFRLSNKVSVCWISASLLASLSSGSVLFIVRDGIVMSWLCSPPASDTEPYSHDAEVTDPAYALSVEVLSLSSSSARVKFEERPSV